MDQFIYWLDTSNLFGSLGPAWPWAVITALVATGTLAGIVAVARRYGDLPRADRLNAM
jgi:hypothetical protein